MMQMICSIALLLALDGTSAIRQTESQAPSTNGSAKAPAPPPSTALPADYVIGPDDVLSVVFWKERDLSAEVVVRPDGKISLPMLNDVSAAGMTPEQLAKSI